MERLIGKRLLAKKRKKKQQPIAEPQIPETPPQEEETPRLGDWPYSIVQSDGDVLAFGEWLQNLGARQEKDLIGLAIHDNELALATREQGWLLSVPGNTIQQEILKQQLGAEKYAPTFICRHLQADVDDLAAALGIGRERLAANVKHDLASIHYTTGRRVMPKDTMSTLKDALDLATVGPQMLLNIPTFYSEVAMPVVRHQASLPEDLGKGTRWAVTYEHLLFKMVAHFTQDPTLLSWLRDGSHPLKAFSQTLNLSLEEGQAFLIWLCCGEDVGLMERVHPGWSQRLPESPALVKASRLDKSLPAFSMGMLRLRDNPLPTTLYGRQTTQRYASELLHFFLFGSCYDILDVAQASFIRKGSHNHFLVPEKESRYNTFVRASIIGYLKDERPDEWQYEMEKVAQLGNPLITPLNAKVLVG